MKEFNSDTQYDDEAEFDYAFNATKKILTIFTVSDITSTYTVALNGIEEAACNAEAANSYTVSVAAEYANPDDTTNNGYPALDTYQGEVTFEGPKAQHDYATVAYDENGHWTVCACGDATASVAHTWDEGTVTTEPQVGVAGVKTFECTFEGCNQTKTEAIDPLPEEVTCEHANAEFYYDETHEPVPAQGTKDGETAKGKAFFKCADCGAIVEEELSYFYYYTTGTTNAALESEILFNFKAQKAHLDRQGAFEDAYIVLDTVKHEDDGGAIRVVTNYADADFDGTYYTVTMGIAGKEMTTAMTTTVYVKYDGKWWSGLQTNKKFVDYATNRFSKSTDIKEKTLLANMLQYGADCQRYFNNGYKLDDLATDYLGDYASLVNTAVPTIDETTVNELALTPSAERSHVGYHLSSLELGSIIKIKFGFRTDFYKGEDLGDITAVCSYLDANNATQSKSYTKDAEENGYGLMSGYTNRYEFWYDGIAAKDMRKTVTATLENASGTIGYKMETSIAAVAGSLRTKNASDTKLVAVINSMINYGDAANAYFYK